MTYTHQILEIMFVYIVDIIKNRVNMEYNYNLKEKLK